jgi:hypothetical protein
VEATDTSRDEGGFAQPQQIVPTRLLQDILKPMLDRLEQDLSAERKHELPRATDHGGAFTVVAERAARALAQGTESGESPATPHSLTRRIYDIYHGIRPRTNLHLAEAFLGAVGEDLNAVPVFPNGINAAREMVETWYWLRDEQHSTSADVIEADARRLVAFTNGFLAAMVLDYD